LPITSYRSGSFANPLYLLIPVKPATHSGEILPGVVWERSTIIEAAKRCLFHPVQRIGLLRGTPTSREFQDIATSVNYHLKEAREGCAV
jgi:hypothetical protein